MICLIQGLWFFVLILCLIGAWNYKYYIEMIISGLVYDSLFGQNAMKGLMTYIGLISATLLYIIVNVSKKIIRTRE